MITPLLNINGHHYRSFISGTMALWIYLRTGGELKLWGPPLDPRPKP